MPGARGRSARSSAGDGRSLATWHAVAACASPHSLIKGWGGQMSGAAPPSFSRLSMASNMQTIIANRPRLITVGITRIFGWALEGAAGLRAPGACALCSVSHPHQEPSGRVCLVGGGAGGSGVDARPTGGAYGVLTCVRTWASGDSKTTRPTDMPWRPHAKTLAAQTSLMSGPVAFTNEHTVRGSSRAVT